MRSAPRFMIAAAHKSSGKTVVSSGIAAALTLRGHRVAPFKKGPDYIDPMWLHLATGRPAYNLDFNTMQSGEIQSLFTAKSRAADISVIEANKGLYDGICPHGTDSNAALAKLLDAPVILVIDSGGMTRGIAPLLQGYIGFDPDVKIAGVILNRTGGARHEGKLRQAVDTYTDIPVLGSIGVSATLDISERHLGLTTPGEVQGNAQFIRDVAGVMEQSVDLDRILLTADAAHDIADTAPPAGPASPPGGKRLRIGIARDRAFAFYYADDLEAFEAAGADLVPVDMIRDPALPQIDGLFIGGGFPETAMDALSDNTSMRDSVRTALANGLPCYAECGGLMYLCRSLTWRGETRAMAGFFPADTVMHDRPQGRGYVRFSVSENALWPTFPRPHDLPAHEFHYASLERLTDPVFARTVTRGFGIDGAHDALVKNNTQAGFIHLRHTQATPWVSDFLDFVARHAASATPRHTVAATATDKNGQAQT